ncbi:MAG: Glycosyltransferase [uncultured Aureispira sp.]|uniref:Glycosyltransferase n=1 Tax=uncultured Aureispira sp. TaxID=1331704 RepID=A0A6S6RS14_9BACT|nr:MAG: Glycosyltransferase [uncultured Aureispira sp.]
MTNIVVIIPAYNEENSVGRVIQDIPASLVKEVIVVNNNSNDQTAIVAKEAGATVLDEVRQGYGFACLKGIDYLKKMECKPDIVVFLDADYSDHPEELPQIVAPILENDVELVIGSRALGDKERGSMTPQQVFGNWLATKLIKWFYGVIYTDLGPFRAIKYDRLIDLNMCDETYGWTVEMQVKAAKQGLKSIEIPVSYRVRVGKSKISGTIKGTILAGYKIITTIFKYK